MKPTYKGHTELHNFSFEGLSETQSINLNVIASVNNKTIIGFEFTNDYRFHDFTIKKRLAVKSYIKGFLKSRGTIK